MLFSHFVWLLKHYALVVLLDDHMAFRLALQDIVVLRGFKQIIRRQLNVFLRYLLEILHRILVLRVPVYPFADSKGGVLATELRVDHVLVSEQMAKLLG